MKDSLSGFIIFLVIFIFLLIIINYFENKFFLKEEYSFWKVFLIILFHSVLFGFSMGVYGALIGAGVPDENAGEAVIFLFFWGGGVGFSISLIFSLVWFFFKKCF